VIFFNKNSVEIIISIGDEGAIVTLFVHGKLSKRVFAGNPYAQEFQAIMASFPNAPVYILLDTIDQNFVEKKLPNLNNPLDVKKIINRNLMNDFDAKDINSYFKGAKDASSPGDLRFIFVSVRNAPPLTDWLEVLNDFNNQIVGIYLAPIESMNFINKVRELAGFDKISDHPKWEILVTHNRVSGLRQIVFKNGDLAFTRVSQIAGGSSPDIIAGSFEQETLSTIEYIRRIGFNDSEKLSIYTISSKEASKMMNLSGTINSEAFKFTPYDVGSKLSLENSAQENDKFGDVILAANFIQSSKKLKLLTPELKYQDKLFFVKSYSKYVAAAIIGLFLTISSLNIFSSFSLGSLKSDAEKTILDLNAKLVKVKDFENEFKIKPEMVVEAIEANKSFSKNTIEFEEVLKKYQSIDNFSSRVESINVSSSGGLKFELSIKFSKNNFASVTNMLSVMEDFSKTVKSSFEPDYQVTFLDMPADKEFKVDSEISDIVIKLQLAKSDEKNKNMGGIPTQLKRK
jgi:hypothetical protein